jgi:hypothetical protein
VSQPIPSAPFLEFDTLTPGTKGVIFSGIAVPEWHINDDGKIYRESYTIDLGYPATQVTYGTASVGLASIYNSGSAFLFGIDDYILGIDPNSQHLTLTVDLACLGAKSNLSRIAYQVVATVVVPETGISGTITFPQGLFGAAPVTLAGLKSLLVITANTFISGGGGGFGSGQTYLVQYGALTSVTTQGGNVIANYNIASPPFNLPLSIQVNPANAFPPNDAIVQIAGPSPITITLQAPAANGVNFIYQSTIVK